MSSGPVGAVIGFLIGFYVDYISNGEYEMAIYINPGDIVTKNLNFVFQYINLQNF